VLLAECDDFVQDRAMPIWCQRRRTEQPPEDRERWFILERQAKVELRVPSRVRPFDVHDPDRRTGDAQAPSCTMRQSAMHGVTPESRLHRSPRRDDHDRHGNTIALEDRINRTRPARQGNHGEPERLGERLPDQIEHASWPGRGTKSRTNVGVPRAKMPTSVASRNQRSTRTRRNDYQPLQGIV
jgi:hypothetical protein